MYKSERRAAGCKIHVNIATVEQLGVWYVHVNNEHRAAECKILANTEQQDVIYVQVETE
jgi:hypothetical protein